MPENERRYRNTARWLVRKPQEFVWQTWGGASIAFHRPSGSTHLMNASGAHLLQSILVRPQSIDDVIDQLAGSEVADGSIRTELVKLLEHFEQLGFIDQV